MAFQQALSGLNTAGKAIDVTSHNVANANTPGYSRQRVSLQTSAPHLVIAMNRSISAGQMGTGVVVADVSRSRSAFVDYQIRKENATLGRWELTQDTLDRLQVIFNEPSDAGLNQTLGQFWQAWQSVTNNPEDKAIRAVVIEQGIAVTDILRRNAEQLSAIQGDVREQLELSVSDLNGIASQIAQLNLQISTSEADGNHANDLRDQRDALVEQLSKIAAVSTTALDTGEIGVFIGGRPLVDRARVTTMRISESDQGFMEPHWEDGQRVELSSGQLSGLVDLQNRVVPQYRADLDALALRIRDAVNSVHVRGYGLDGSTGNAFFTGTDAQSLGVSADVQADAAKVATGRAPNTPGDATIALAIAQVQHSQTGLAATSTVRPEQALAFATGVRALGVDVSQAVPAKTFTLTAGGPGEIVMNDGATTQTLNVASMTSAGTQVLDFSSFGVVITLGAGGTAADTSANIIAGLTGSVATSADLSSINQDYETFIGNLGIDARSAATMVRNQNVLVQHLERQRDSISGVSLEDETVDLVRYQHAYQAAARLITAMDELLERLINGTGTVGR